MSGLSLLGLTVLELKSPVFGQGFFLSENGYKRLGYSPVLSVQYLAEVIYGTN